MSSELTEQQSCVLRDALYGPREAGNWDQMATKETELRELADDLEAGRPDATAFIYETLGECYFRLGNYEKAIAFWGKARTILLNLGGRATHVGGLIQNIGACYQEQSSFLKAIELFEQAQAIAEGAGDCKGSGCNMRQAWGLLLFTQAVHPM